MDLSLNFDLWKLHSCTVYLFTNPHSLNRNVQAPTMCQTLAGGMMNQTASAFIETLFYPILRSSVL